MVEALSPVESNIDPPISGSIKVSLQVEVKSYCFPTEYCYDQVRVQSRRYSQRTKNLIHLTHPWRYPDFLYGQRFEVILHAVVLFTILVMCSDTQTKLLCFDISNSAVELYCNSEVWC